MMKTKKEEEVFNTLKQLKVSREYRQKSELMSHVGKTNLIYGTTNVNQYESDICNRKGIFNCVGSK